MKKTQEVLRKIIEDFETASTKTNVADVCR